MAKDDPWQNKLHAQALADLRKWSQLPYEDFLSRYNQSFGINVNRYAGLGMQNASPADLQMAKNSPLFPTASTAHIRNAYNAPYFDLNTSMLQRLRETSKVIGGSLKTPGFGSDQNTTEDYYNYLRNMTPAQQAEYDRVTALINSRADDYGSSLEMAMQPWGAIPVATAFLGALGTTGAGPLGKVLGPAGTTGTMPTGGLISTGAYPGGMIGTSAGSGSSLLGGFFNFDTLTSPSSILKKVGSSLLNLGDSGDGDSKTMSILESILGTAGGALAGSLVNSLFAPDPNDLLGPLLAAQQQAAKTPLIKAGGLTSSMPGGRLTIKPSGSRNLLINNMAAQFGRQAGELTTLMDEVKPGYGRLTDAAVLSNQRARERTVGDLKDMMARRRISGSSFAMDTVSRSEAEFAEQENRLRADSFLKELDMTFNLLQQRQALQQKQFSVVLDELNLETSVALQLAGKGSEAFALLAKAQSDILLDQATSQGAMVASGANLGYQIMNPQPDILEILSALRG